MQDLQEQFGLTYLFISHDLAVVDLVCDEVIVLHQGRVVERGSPERCSAHPQHPYTRRLLAAVPRRRRLAPQCAHQADDAAACAECNAIATSRAWRPRTTISRRTLNAAARRPPLAVALPSATGAVAQGHAWCSAWCSSRRAWTRPPAPAAAIGEIVHYNMLEGLTKIGMDGAVTPLLAESWRCRPMARAYTFKLRRGIKFSDGAAFDAQAVKFSFDRAKAPKAAPTRRRRRCSTTSPASPRPTPYTVILVLNNADATLPFRLGENTAVILHPKSVGHQRRPSRSAPARTPVDSWKKGSSVTLVEVGRLPRPRCHQDQQGQLPLHQRPVGAGGGAAGRRHRRHAALRCPAGLKQFQGDKRFTVEIGSTAGKGILAINNKKPPLNDVRVRRAIDARDRPQGLHRRCAGRPGQAHRQPLRAHRRRLRRPDRVYPYDPEKAKALLREAGVTTPLNLTLTLPPPQYARKGGEIIAAQLAKVGINREDRERRMGAVAERPVQGQLRPDHHQPRRAAGLRATYANPTTTSATTARSSATWWPQLRGHQRRRAQQGRCGRRSSASWPTTPSTPSSGTRRRWRSARSLKGLWNSSPIFANDMAAVSWTSGK